MRRARRREERDEKEVREERGRTIDEVIYKSTLVFCETFDSMLLVLLNLCCVMGIGFILEHSDLTYSTLIEDSAVISFLILSECILLAPQQDNKYMMYCDVCYEVLEGR